MRRSSALAIRLHRRVPTEVLAEILAYADRDRLERLAALSRRFRDLIRREFALRPYRVLSKLIVAYASARKRRPTSTHDESLEAGVADAQVVIIRRGCGALLYRLDAVAPRLRPAWLRFRATGVWLSAEEASVDALAALVRQLHTNFAHLWSDQELQLVFVGGCDEMLGGCVILFLCVCYMRQIFLSRVEVVFSVQCAQSTGRMQATPSALWTNNAVAAVDNGGLDAHADAYSTRVVQSPAVPTPASPQILGAASRAGRCRRLSPRGLVCARRETIALGGAVPKNRHRHRARHSVGEKGVHHSVGGALIAFFRGEGATPVSPHFLSVINYS